MNVRLSATGRLKESFGDEGVLVELPSTATVGDALVAARERVGVTGFDLSLDEAGRLPPGVAIVVNDEMLPRGRADAALADGDQVTLLLAVAGGTSP